MVDNVDIDKYLLEKNSASLVSKKHLKNKVVKIRQHYAYLLNLNREYFDFNSLIEITKFIKAVRQNLGNQRPHLLFSIEGKLKNKLTLSMFEAICYQLLNDGYKVNVQYAIKSDILGDEINVSPVKFLGIRKDSPSTFKRLYKYEISRNKFRKVISKVEGNSGEILSTLLVDLQNFLAFNINDSTLITMVSKTLTELVGNAITHGESDCVIDVTVTQPTYRSTNAPQKEFYGLSITIFNLSDVLFSEKVKQKIMTAKKFEGRNQERYYKILEAFDYHKNYFSNSYKDDDFWNLTAIQNRISGRPSVNSGGKGLRDLVKSIQHLASRDICFLVSGDRGLNLYKEDYHSLDDEWIGLNSDNNFLSSIPDESRFFKSNFYIGGTAYNLMFVMENK